MIRRINIFAGPSSGKSTVAAGIYHRLKSDGVNCEMCREKIKDWAWLDRQPESFDQVLISAQQLHSEDIILRHTSKPIIVTDCPILLNAAYAKKNNLSFAEELMQISLRFEESYPSLNIFLNRGDRPFRPEGRWGTREDAIQTDAFIKNFIKDKILFKEFRYDNFNGIIDHIYKKIV